MTHKINHNKKIKPTKAFTSILFVWFLYVTCQECSNHCLRWGQTTTVCVYFKRSHTSLEVQTFVIWESADATPRTSIMRSARCSPGRLAVTLTYAHTHGPDRDKWSPQRGEERIETGAITQNLHSYSAKKIRSRICADAWTHICSQTKTHAPHTLVWTQWPKTPARTEPLVCVLGEPFFFLV